MKKTSTLAMSLLLAAGAWAGLAYNDPVLTAEMSTATFDFETNQYGYNIESGNSSNYLPADAKFVEDDGKVTITIDKKEGAGVRFWTGPELRVMKNSAITVSVPQGDILIVSFWGANVDKLKFPTNDFFGAAGSMIGSDADRVFTSIAFGKVESVTFTAPADARVDIKKITVQYEGGVAVAPDTRLDAGLAIEGGETEFTATLGEPFTAPVITKATTAPLTYTSTVASVATVDAEGNVTLVGKGTTKITASAAENDEYKAGSVTYTLNVVKALPEGAIYSSDMGTDFTFEPDADIWVHDAKYGLKGAGSAYVPGVGNMNFQAESTAVSPVVELPADKQITLLFSQAINYLKSNPIADNGNIVVRTNDDNGISDWTVIPDAVLAPEADSWTFYANTPVDLSAYAGKKIQFGFKYNSTQEVAMTWEIQDIVVTATEPSDPLAAVKAAALEEGLTYLNLLEGITGMSNPWMVNGFQSAIEAAETEEEVTATLEEVKTQIRDNVYAKMTFNFTWLQNDLFVTYTDNAFAGVADYSPAAVFNSERVNERSWRPWNLTEGEDEPRQSNDQDAIMIQNLKSGLYLALPSKAGEAVTTVADKAQAGYIVVALADGKIALADDATGLYLALDAEKGLILSETPEMLGLGALENFDKDSDYHISVSFPGSYVGEWGMEYAHEVSTVEIAVTPGLKISDIAKIEIQGLDENWQTYTIQAFSATALQSITPEKGEGFFLQWNNETWTNDKVPFEADVYTLALREKLTTPGTYSVFIAEGTFFTEIDGKPVYSEEEDATINIEGEILPCEPVVNPVEGKVDELEVIAITGGEQPILEINWNSASDAVITLASETETIKTWTKDEVVAAMLPLQEFTDPNIYELKLEEKIIATGTYTLTIPAEFFINESEQLNAEKTVTWTIENIEDSISEINASSAAAPTFDLQGRRVNASARGILIQGGKKILIRK